MNSSDRKLQRLQSLAIPLAMSVVVIGATASLFRPAFTISPPVLTVSAKPIGKATTATAQNPQGAADTALTTGRSVDVRLSLSAEEVTRMVSRGKALVDAGDFAAARLLLSRAADAGDADATFTLASTYDPNVLVAQGARGLTGDANEAKALYARALTAGIQDAKQRIAALGG